MVAEFMKYQPHGGGQITYYLRKRLKEVDENSIRINDCLSDSISLISTFTWHIDFKNRGNYCNVPLLHMGVPVRG